MKNLAIWFVVLVLAIPLDQWRAVSEVEREKTRSMAIEQHLSNQGGKVFRIWELIRDGQWQLHIEEKKTEV